MLCLVWTNGWRAVCFDGVGLGQKAVAYSLSFSAVLPAIYCGRLLSLTQSRGARAPPSGGHKSRCVCVEGGRGVCVCVCVCVGSVEKRAICDRVQLLTLAKSMQLLSYVRCFIGFTFAFEIDHVQQGGERMETGGTVTRLGPPPSLPLAPALDIMNWELGFTSLCMVCKYFLLKGIIMHYQLFKL